MQFPPPTQPKSAEEVEREQEAKLKAKYGGLQPKRKLMPKVCASLTNWAAIVRGQQA